MRFKYPRTLHLPFSNGSSNDDVWLKNCNLFAGKEVVVTEKLDGECTTIYPDGFVHARSIDTAHHPSRSWVKQLAARVAPNIPANLRICGENVFAFHSILYTELTSYFFVFGIYEGQRCLPWDEIVDMCQILELELAPVIYKGIWDESKIQSLWKGQGAFPTFMTHKKEKFIFPDDFVSCEAEGYVVRTIDGFAMDDFHSCCGKYVRANHVQTDQNWMTRPVFPNSLKAQ
jgi:hypothetical protein